VNFGYPNKCFFTVGKSAAGSWWFVDPLGKPFLSLGVTSVSYWGDTSTTGTSSTIGLFSYVREVFYLLGTKTAVCTPGGPDPLIA
jgi:hypothetical protein